jgi:dephospho-CoA kinase
MLNVALTGGIACGKSTVASMFVQKGAHLIDFDVLAHEVQKPGRAAWEKVVGYFGEGILFPDKIIDRIKLAEIVFSDTQKLTALNQIVHPYVFLEWHDHLEKIANTEKNAIIIAAVPLLFEVNSQHLFDVNLLVFASEEQQLNRLIQRNKLSEEEARKRINSQMPIEQKAVLADIVIDNKDFLSDTQKRVEEVWQLLIKMEQNPAMIPKNKKS